MRATIQHIKKELSGFYPETEIKAFVRIILENVCGLNYTEQILKIDEVIDSESSKKIAEVVERLKKFEPVQYIFGETEFYGLKLKVTPAVLIPRPETEELVNWIADTVFGDDLAVIDIGTGSGCLALSLKKQFPQADVSGVDISEESLEVARQNALLNNLDVTFFNADILRWEEFDRKSYSLIVSNPPYVRESEKELMEPNVLEYEPTTALFVPDENPLLYYIALARFAKTHLTENGWLFLEINEMFGSETEELLKKEGFKEIEIKKDLNGKERMISCRKNNF